MKSGSLHPHIILLPSVENNKFMLLWEKDDKTHYLLIDEYGNKLSEEITVDFRLSDCPPVIYNNNLIWYTQESSVLNFYKINLSNIATVSKTEKKYGCEFVLKSITDDTANVECKKCKKTSFTAVFRPKQPISGCRIRKLISTRRRDGSRR